MDSCKLLKKHKALISKCAELSLKSYTSIQSSENQIVYTIEDKPTDCKVFVIRDLNTLYITGPGSVSLTDWYLDFQIWRTRVDYLDNTLVHAGFMKAYNAIRNKLISYVEVQLRKYEIKKIVCTGHSLWGAIASIAAADMSSLDNVHVTCVTFGSPRVGNSDFAQYFNTNVDTSFRCVFEKDPITFTPIPLRFKHVRGHIKCTYTGDVENTDNFNKWNCIGCRISHHSMDSYCNSFNIH